MGENLNSDFLCKGDQINIVNLKVLIPINWLINPRIFM